MRRPDGNWVVSILPIVFLLLLSFVVNVSDAQQGATCNKLQSCKVGCCSAAGHCGFGDAFCKQGCQGTCNATAECGQHAKQGEFDCPLNVCCSEHGFCGYDSLFCNDKCQNKDKSKCGPVSRPQCSESTDAMAADVRIGYFGAWSAERGCDAMQPENIPAGVLTHINVAFEYISADHEITDKVGHITGRTSRLKNIYPNLRVNIALGGWVFNDPPTQTRFSDMASTVPNRNKFIKSLIAYMEKYNLDGVDIDWEYPVAPDRGGRPEDYSNLILLCADIREAFDSYDPGWQLTLTLPASLWYLKHFDIIRLEKYVDWFNVMTYDIHGIWDQDNIWTGPFLKGHTNITEIEDGFDLLWRNGISSKKVVMGYGFYGRGFTMESPSCSTPPNCKFSGPAFAGDCTNEPGILSYNEVISKKGELSASIKYDETSSVKWMVYGSNQWVSFDDAESFQKKLKYMYSRCLKGLMIWDLGLDTANYDALIGLFGEEAVSNGRQDTSLNPAEENKLAFDLSAYTGQNCYIPAGCTDGKNTIDPINKESAMCKPGFSSVATGHDLPDMTGTSVFWTGCEKGKYHHICCPTKAMPKNCEWIGAPKRSAFGCSGKCGDSQFELSQDFSADSFGNKQCGSGKRKLCCDSTDVLKKCKWTGCDWTQDSNGHCKSNEINVATRYDQDDRKKCKVQTGMGNGGNGGTTTHQHFRSFCCPKDDPLEKCSWSNDPDYFVPKRDEGTLKCKGEKAAAQCKKDGICHSVTCFEGKVAVTSAAITPPLYEAAKTDASCGLEDRSYKDPTLCCSPPSRLTKNWPVNPAYLWSKAYSDKNDDVTWDWANNFGSNHKDTSPNNLETDPGDDPYGFVMLDGPPGSIAKQFPKQFTFVTVDEPKAVVARSFVTTNKTVLDATFDHVEEEYLVYCNHAHDSKDCNEIFHKGAVDTIIKLPHHIGEGPFARVVSMEPEYMPPTLPEWAIRKRDASGVPQNGLYRLKIDYAFHEIKRADDETVNMRVDYTNLKNYWDDVTDEPSKKKRSASDTMDYHSWRARVDAAKNASYVEGHDEFDVATAGQTDFSPHGEVPPAKRSADNVHSADLYDENHLSRRWWGTFTAWLNKLNTITKSDDGFLPMSISKFFNIYSGRLQCANEAGVTLTAGLDITAEVRLEMGARYAYYFSGTVVPPNIIDTYVFLGAQPSVYAGIDIRGNAELGYESERKKLVSTITYPGLSIKGIATVGPSLDLWGQLAGKITVSGNMKVGAKYTMDPIEYYMPNDDVTRQKASNKMSKFDKDQAGLSPLFQAGVKATVGVELRITPEINCGIKVGGEIGLLKQPLVQAQVAVYMNTTLYFEAHATADTDGKTGNWEYGYKIDFRWRVGMDAVASLHLYGSWKSGEYEAVPWQTIPIYGPIVVKSASTISTRNLPTISGRDDLKPWEVPEDPLPNALFGLPDYSAIYAAAPAADSMMVSAHLYNHTDMDIPNPSNVSARGLDLYNSPLHAIHRRADGKENEFMLGDFKCTSGNSPCSASLPGTTKFRPRGHGQSLAIRTIPGLVKRATSDCPNTLPRLYYNCVGMFSNSRVVGPSGSAVIPGICTSVKSYLFNHGINTNQFPLTWDTQYSSKRRSQTCRKVVNPCTNENTGANLVYRRALGIEKDVSSCDEFPFASTEEGGLNWNVDIGDAGLNPANPLGTTRVCVPTWQQSLQGNCNDILNKILTNVEYFNTAGSPTDQNPSWFAWNSAAGWNTAGTMAGGKPRGEGRQRITRYPTQRNYLYHQENINDRYLDWYHKRNFTLFLVNNAPGSTASFPGNDFSSGKNGVAATNAGGKPVTEAVTDASWIICAVSLRGQQRYKFSGNYNGYCWDGQTMESEMQGAFQRIKYWGCKIDFVGAAFVNKKRSEPIGFFHDEAVYGIERVEDAPVIELELPMKDIPLPDKRTSFPVG